MPTYLSGEDLRRWPHLAALIAQKQQETGAGTVHEDAPETAVRRRRRSRRRLRSPLERWLWPTLIGVPVATAALVVGSTLFVLYLWPRTQIHGAPPAATRQVAITTAAGSATSLGTARASSPLPSTNGESGSGTTTLAPTLSTTAPGVTTSPASTTPAGTVAPSPATSAAKAQTSSVTASADGSVAANSRSASGITGDGGSGTGAGPIDTAAFAPGGPLGPQCTPETVMSLPLGEIRDVDTCAVDAQFLATDVNADRCATGAPWDAMACPDNNTALPPQWAVAQQWLDFALAGNRIAQPYTLRCAQLRPSDGGPNQCAAVPPGFSLEEYLHPSVHVCRQTPCTIPYK